MKKKKKNFGPGFVPQTALMILEKCLERSLGEEEGKKKSLFGLMRWENVEKKMQMMLSQGQLSCSQLLLHTSVGLSSAKQVT